MFKNRLVIGIIIIRVILGITMLLHGVAKFTDLTGTQQFFESIGVPGIVAIFTALVEVVGGIFMIAGILVPLVSLGFIAILLSAMYLLKAQSGFVNGYELELLLAVISLGVGISHFDKKIVQFIPTK